MATEIQETTKLERDYNRLKTTIFSTLGVLIPDFESYKAKPVVKFIEAFATEQFNSGRSSSHNTVKTEDQVLKESANHPDAKYFKIALSAIMDGMDKKSIHQIIGELDKLNRLVNR